MIRARATPFETVGRLLLLSSAILFFSFQKPRQGLALALGGVKVEPGEFKIEFELLQRASGDGEDAVAEPGLLQDVLNQRFEFGANLLGLRLHPSAQFQ